MQEHEGEEGRRVRWRRRHQGPHEAPEPDGLDAEVGPHEGLASRGRVAFGEDEVDHRQHRLEPGRQVRRARYRVGNARVADLALRAHEPLRHGRDRHEERARDLVRLETAERAEGERDLGLERQRRVTAGEDQTQAIVGDIARIERRRRDGQARFGRDVGGNLLREPALAADAVDGLVPRRLDDPGPRRFRHAGGPPLVHGGGKGFLRGFFRDVEVPDEPDQSGDDPAPVGAIHGVDGHIGIHGHRATVDNFGAGVDRGPGRSTP